MDASTAKHFCQLMVCSNEGTVTSLNAYIRQQQGIADDSLTVEQLFTSYVFDYDGWQTLKVFPHRSAHGTVVWYAAADRLPNDMDVEHQKYIQEVFPRLQQEVEHENWPVVDAYISRMLNYQTTFGAPTVHHPSPIAHYPSLILPFAIALFLAFLSLSFCRRIAKHRK